MRSGDSIVLHRGLRHWFGEGGGILPLFALWFLLLLLPGPAGAFTLGRTPALLLTGDQGYDNFGSAASTAGDVNGDGYSDLIVGAYKYDDPEQDEGKAFLYLGTPHGLSPVPVWSGESNQFQANYGYSVAAAGDVNGDGLGDVIIGARFFSYTATEGGRAYLYNGTPTGLTIGPTWVVDGDRDQELLGQSVACAGDVNGDGYDDVIVGAERFTDSKPDQGRALLYYGSAQGLSPAAGWWYDGDQPRESVGWSVAGAGDVNGDGFDDVIVGAPGYYVMGDSVGAAFVFLGSATGLSPTPVWMTTGSKAMDYTGYCVSSAGDVNGDGYSDILVGSPRADGINGDEGKADLFLGSPTGPSAVPFCTFSSGEAGAWFGYSTQTAGDLNGDGYADILISAPLGGNWLGRVYLYLGAAAGPSTEATWTQTGTSAWEVLGESVGGAGDVNGDGYSDMYLATGYYTSSQTFGGEVQIFHGLGFGTSASAAWSATGPGSGAALGSAVSSAGDLNGDGRTDVVVGAPAATLATAAEGAAFVYLGAEGGLGGTPVWTGRGAQTGCGYGSAVSSAGDVNGDGWDDLLIGAPAFDNRFLDEGRAFLYLGSETGPAATPAWVVDGGQERAGFGSAVAGAGDLNGDGYADVLVGAPGAGGAFPAEGRAALYYGSPQGLSSSAGWTAGGGSDSASFGASVALAGDVNGDGFSDIIVGAPGFSSGPDKAGEVLVYLGSASGPAAAPAWVAQGDRAGELLGSFVAAAGDVNGDGYDDVIVGAPGYANSLAGQGAAFVYLGSASGLAAAPGWSVEGNEAGAHLGTAVASAGDPGGSGFSAVAVGLPGWAGGLAGQGRVLVYPGSSTGPSSTPTTRIAGSLAGAGLGRSLCPAGDVSGDGCADLLAGAPGMDAGLPGQGSALLYEGNERDAFNPGRSWLPRQSGLGAQPIALRGASDDASSFRLQATGFCPRGRRKVRLEWQAAPLGSPLSTAVLEHGAWIDPGPPVPGAGSTAGLLATVTGCTADAPYHWRLRIAAHDTRFPFSPWLTLPGSVSTESQLRIKPALISGVGGRTPGSEGGAPGLACPNPFRPGMEITYASPVAGPVRLTLFDGTGRLVAVLLDGNLQAGRHAVRWDGRTLRGRPAAPGVYFARCQAGDHTVTGRFAFLPGRAE